MRKRNKKGHRKTTCSCCGVEVEESRKGQRYCKKCHAINWRINRPLHRQLKPDARKKANARAYANTYLNRGKIMKYPCIICGNKESQMHHNDYDKPLEIIWYCREHHLQLHKKT